MEVHSASRLKHLTFFHQRYIRTTFLNFYFGNMSSGPVFRNPVFRTMSRCPHLPEVKSMPLSIGGYKHSHFFPGTILGAIISYGVHGEKAELTPAWVFRV